MRIMKNIVLAFSLLIAINSYGQDYHYWSEHFGARAALLGGAATAGLGDIATTYYNPAAMAFVDKTTLSVTVNAYKIRSVKLHNIVGDDLDMKQTQFTTFPNFIGGIVKFKNLPKIRLGYAVLAKKNFISSFDYLHQEDYELVDTTLGSERYVSSYSLHHSINEYSAGFALSYKLSKSWSLGFAHFGTYRAVKYSNSIDVNIFPSDYSLNSVVYVASQVNFNYYNVKGVFKPSIALDAGNFKFGLAYTTPSFNIMGKGNVYRKVALLNVEFHPGYFGSVSLVDSRKGVKAVHKEFGALAVGVSWRIKKKAWLHITNELFFPGDYYLIMDPENQVNAYPDFFFTPDTVYTWFGEQNYLAYGEQTVQVFNMGIGFESKIGERWEILLGARTDFLSNYSVSTHVTGRIGVETSKWELYHFSLGFSHVSKKSKKLTVGLEYGMTPNRNIYQFVNFTNPDPDIVYYGDVSAIAYPTQFSLELIIGIELNMAKMFSSEEIPVDP